MTPDLLQELSDTNDCVAQDRPALNYNYTAPREISAIEFSLDPPSDIASSPFESWDDINMTFRNFNPEAKASPLPKMEVKSTRTSSIRIVPRSNSDEISVQSPDKTADPENDRSLQATNTTSMTNQWSKVKYHNSTRSQAILSSREVSELRTNQIWCRSAAPTQTSCLHIKIVRLSHYRRFKRVF